MEEWRDIQGYEGLYQVSSCGRVKSLNYNKTGQERILKQVKRKEGYKYITLCKNGKIKTYKVHRLVATTFIDNPSNYPCINHIDEQPYNNYKENLEWCTYKYNNNYGDHNKRMSRTKTGKYTGANNPSARKVQASTGEIFDTVSEATKWCNLKSIGNIVNQIQGIRKTAGKHPVTKEPLQWQYVDKK